MAQEAQVDSLSFSVLASGSSGNCTYIESAKQRILVDAGLSGKKIINLLAEIDRSPQGLDAILVTHEHIDHVQGVGILSRKFNIPIYANRATWSVMETMIGQIAPENKRFVEANQLISLGDIDVQTYSVSHDAIDPQFYAFQKGKKVFAMLTDTGYVSDRLLGQLANASAYLIESNHEVEMLRYGKYPWSVKQRILGDKGHLSNEDGALAMSQLIGQATKHIYLGHLSKDNNTKEIAMDTMTRLLQSKDFAVHQDFSLNMTDPAQSTQLRKL
ncbi:MBL fold metallo-hydrolase [Vaginisenegalia massiliensis]|uniref:MBL fold metallo-hydrolase n=1 Tax=Vaginisenegalia massiliensis TaxID=2058294 RepID=UPI0013DE2298|nr:MBL fold metallo-hydrolase [Vaginisenegalia massiliensis]